MDRVTQLQSPADFPCHSRLSLSITRFTPDARGARLTAPSSESEREKRCDSPTTASEVASAPHGETARCSRTRVLVRMHWKAMSRGSGTGPRSRCTSCGCFGSRRRAATATPAAVGRTAARACTAALDPRWLAPADSRVGPRRAEAGGRSELASATWHGRVDGAMMLAVVMVGVVGERHARARAASSSGSCCACVCVRACAGGQSRRRQRRRRRRQANCADLRRRQQERQQRSISQLEARQRRVEPLF